MMRLLTALVLTMAAFVAWAAPTGQAYAATVSKVDRERNMLHISRWGDRPSLSEVLDLRFVS